MFIFVFHMQTKWHWPS